jgi:CarD family transcriptional regulator
MFKVNDYAVYPGHGVGQITSITTKEILGKVHTFLCLEILVSGMKILLQQNTLAEVGVRPVISKQKALELVAFLEADTPKPSYSETWNRRYREYMELIKTGNIDDLAKVLKELRYLEEDKELSFGERKMLDTAQNLVGLELKIALGGRV